MGKGLLSLGSLRTDTPFSFGYGQLEEATRAPTILVGLLSDRRGTLGCMSLNGHGNGNWWDWNDRDERRVRDSHGKEALEILRHGLDDCGQFFKCVISNLEAGRPDSSMLMFLKLVANFNMFR